MQAKSFMCVLSLTVEDLPLSQIMNSDQFDPSLGWGSELVYKFGPSELYPESSDGEVAAFT